MNRVRSGGYPNSISGVVYQAGQFSVSGRIAATAASGVKSSCMQAAQAAIGGMDNTGGALSFAPVSSGRGGLVMEIIHFTKKYNKTIIWRLYQR